jgi:hypothetical protein
VTEGIPFSDTIGSVPRTSRDQVFLNVPFDEAYAPLYVTMIASLTALGMTPRSVLEVPPHDHARLTRLMTIVRSCGASIHDLSRVEVPKGVPRFNMPFELGLTLGLHRAGHRWFVFESVEHRVARSLSDLGGYDAVRIHGGSAKGVVRAVHDAFRSSRRAVTLPDFEAVCRALRLVAKRIKHEHDTLFSRTSFQDLVLAGHETAKLYFA